MNFDPFTTVNCNSTNEDKAYKVTLGLPIVMPDIITMKEGSVSNTCVYFLRCCLTVLSNEGFKQKFGIFSHIVFYLTNVSVILEGIDWMINGLDLMISTT